MRSAFCCCLVFVSSMFAQRGTGELRLMVKDPAGALVPATVDLVSESSRTHQAVEVPAEGYAFHNLPFGIYRLKVSHEGFTTTSQLVEVRSEAPKTLEIHLGIVPIEEAVTVKDAATLMDPSRTGAGYYVGAKDVAERPTGLAGRDLINLIVMQPGWFLEANGSLHPRESEYQTQYVINGFPILDNRSPAFAPSVQADDVQSMKVYTSGIPAEFGRKLGGIIEINTDRNASPGFHGVAVLQGGSFDTAGGFLSGQYVTGKTTGTLTAEGFLTDRYLDPPVQNNYTNHGSSTSFTGTIEHDFTDSDRVRVSAAHRENWFLVPNEQLQQLAGQRQDRTSAETEGQVSYQHVFSPYLVGTARGMVRDVTADLWSNPLASPISASQDRSFREGYVNGSIAGHWGRHEWKAGTEASFASIDENFGYNIVAYELSGVRIFDSDTPKTLAFRGSAPDREQAGYIQDLIRLGPVTLSAGLRFDHYHLLVDESAFSPRLGASWYIPRIGMVFRASYDRAFSTPAFENILVSASPQVLQLNNNALYLPVKPSRGNYYEAGFSKEIAKTWRLDATFFRRDIRNFADDDLLLNTGVSFPIAFHSAEIRGVEVKLQTPRLGPFSGFVSWSNMLGVGQFPIAGGLFLDDNSPQLLQSTEKFPVTQDQRNVVRAVARYQITKRAWTAWTGSYNSGLPVESGDQSLDFLTAQYGSAVVNQVNWDRGRVRPSFSLDASVGVEVWRHEKRSATLQVDALNLTDRLNVINFAGLFSGTAIAPPRSFGGRLRIEF